MNPTKQSISTHFTKREPIPWWLLFFPGPCLKREGFRYYSHFDFIDEADFNDYMNNIRQMTLYDTGETAVYGDRLITLSTCEYSQEDGRMAVIAKKVD